MLLPLSGINKISGNTTATSNLRHIYDWIVRFTLPPLLHLWQVRAITVLLINSKNMTIIVRAIPNCFQTDIRFRRSSEYGYFTAVTNLLDSLGGTGFVNECDEAEAAVVARHRVHHQAQVPDCPTFLKQRNQLVFKHFLRDMTTKHLHMST